MEIDRAKISLVAMVLSEGKTAQKIDAVAQLLDRAHGIRLIHVRPEPALNRTHLLFGGERENLLEAALDCMAVVNNEIHIQEDSEADIIHYGAVPLLSFMPLCGKGLTAEVDLARRFSQSFAEAYQVPVCMVGAASDSKNEQDLVRYLGEHSQQPFAPDTADFGPEQVNPRLGHTVVAARYYHINCALYFDRREIDLIEDLVQVHEQVAVAGEKGRAQDYQELARILPHVHVFVDETSNPRMVRLWCNIPNYFTLSPKRLINAFREAAGQLAVGYLGSRIMGFVPAEVFGRERITEDKNLGENDLQYIIEGISELNLSEIESFRPKIQLLDCHFDRELRDRLPPLL